MGAVRRRLTGAMWALACLTGCAGAPLWPAEMRSHDAVLIDAGGAPQVQVAEGHWGGRGVTTGGTVGAGTGLAVGAAACAATGPMAPLCLATVVPLSTVVGVATGAAAGNLADRNRPGVKEKVALAQSSWDAAVQRRPLGAAVAEQANAHGVPLASAGTPAAWRLTVQYGPLLALASDRDERFALSVQATLAVERLRDNQRWPARHFQAASAEALTLEQWAEGQRIDRTLDELAANVAAQIVSTLRTGTP